MLPLSDFCNLLGMCQFYDFLSMKTWLALSQLCQATQSILKDVQRFDQRVELSIQVPSSDALMNVPEIHARITQAQAQWPNLRFALSLPKGLNVQLTCLRPFATLDHVHLSRLAPGVSSDLGALRTTTTSTSSHSNTLNHSQQHQHCLTSLSLDTCGHVTSLVHLASQLRHLTLDACQGIEPSDLSTLVLLETLVLRRCFQLTNVSGLSCLRTLVMEANNEHATKVSGLASLSKLRSITLINVGILHEEQHTADKTSSLASYYHALRHCTSVRLENSSLQQLVFAPSSVLSPPGERFIIASRKCSLVEQAKSVVLHQARITSVEGLVHVRHIDLSGCWKLTDVSPFAQVVPNNMIVYLNLSDCQNVTDVSSLGRVRELNLTNCFRITDVSGLANVERLNLTGCWNVTDVSSLSRVRELDLSGCGKLTSISSLDQVSELTLGGNRRLVSSSSATQLLASVHQLRKIHLVDCINITQVTGFSGIERVYINGSRQLTDVSPLVRISHLTLEHCPFVHDVGPLRHIRHLVLRHCSSIADLSPLACDCTIQKIVLERIPFQDAAPLVGIPTIAIDDCWGFLNCQLLVNQTPHLHLIGCGCEQHVLTRRSNT